MIFRRGWWFTSTSEFVYYVTWTILVPAKMCLDLLHLDHHLKMTGHRNQIYMFKHLRWEYYWTLMVAYMVLNDLSCPQCAPNLFSHYTSKAGDPFVPQPVADLVRPRRFRWLFWQRLNPLIDLFFSLPIFAPSSHSSLHASSQWASKCSRN